MAPFNHNRAAAPDKGAALAKLKLDLDVASTNARQAGLSELAIVAEFRTRVENWDRKEIMNKPVRGQGFSVEKVAAILNSGNDRAPTLAKLAR
jgi:hypothetical protein